MTTALHRQAQRAAAIDEAAAIPANNPKKLLFVHADCGDDIVEIGFGTGEDFASGVEDVIGALENNQKVIAHVIDLPRPMLDELVKTICQLAEYHDWRPALREQFESVPAGDATTDDDASDAKLVPLTDDEVAALLGDMTYQHAKPVDAAAAYDELSGCAATGVTEAQYEKVEVRDDDAAEPLPQDRQTILLAHANCDPDVEQIVISGTNFLGGVSTALHLLRINTQVLIDVSELSEDAIAVLLDAAEREAEIHNWTLGYERTHGEVLRHHGERVHLPTPGYVSEFIDELLGEHREAERATVAIEKDASSRINNLTAVHAAMHGAGIATALALDPTLKYDKEELAVMVCNALVQNQQAVAEIFDISDQAIADIDEALAESATPPSASFVEVDHDLDGLSPAELDQKQLDREDAERAFETSIDAVLWARAFMSGLEGWEHEDDFVIDEALMRGWFAQALLSGLNAGHRHEKASAELLARNRIEAAIGDEVHH